MRRPVLKKYLAADKVSCSRTHHSDSTGGEAPIATLLSHQLKHCALTGSPSKLLQPCTKILGASAYI